MLQLHTHNPIILHRDLKVRTGAAPMPQAAATAATAWLGLLGCSARQAGGRGAAAMRWAAATTIAAWLGVVLSWTWGCLQSPNLVVDRHWVTKVTDFGLSRLYASTNTSHAGSAAATNPRQGGLRLCSSGERRWGWAGRAGPLILCSCCLQVDVPRSHLPPAVQCCS